MKKKLEANKQLYKENANKHHHIKIFKEGDFVWVILKKECFPIKSLKQTYRKEE